MGRKSCRWLEETSEMSRTSLHYQNGLLKTLNELLWKDCGIHPLSYANKLYKNHIVSKDLVTHKKAGNVLDTHAIPRLFHAQAKRLATLAN